MVYLYAGLGVVMLTGIMAIFEMGLSLTGQSMLPTPPDKYLENAFNDADKKIILELLINREVYAGVNDGESLCKALRDFGEDYGYELTPISGGYWKNSCSLNRGSHRALVKLAGRSDVLTPNQLFSCHLNNNDELCSFEQEWYLND